MNKKLKIHIWGIKPISSETQINTADLVNCDFYYSRMSNLNANQSFFEVSIHAPGKCIISLCFHVMKFMFCNLSKSYQEQEHMYS